MILNLAGNNLTGTIPAELGGMDNLRCLDLSHNYLSGAVPPELKNLRLAAGRITPNLLGNNPGFAAHVGRPHSAKWVTVRSIHRGPVSPEEATPDNMKALRNTIARAEQDILTLVLEENFETSEQVAQAWEELRSENYPGLTGWKLMLHRVFCAYCQQEPAQPSDTNCPHCEMPFAKES